MIRTFQRIYRIPIVWVILAISVSATISGCEYFPESTFKLANESRLPKWIVLPPGLVRANISLTMNYYVKPWGRSAQFVLRDKNNRVIKKEVGKMRCSEPFLLKNHSQDPSFDYPAYEAITVNGITEIIEHRKMEPIFYVTDDAAVWRKYSASGCG